MSNRLLRRKNRGVVLTKSLATALAPFKVRVKRHLPGLVKKAHFGGRTSKYGRPNPYGRPIRLDEIGKTVNWLVI